MCALFLFAQGGERIIGERVYFDQATIARQLAAGSSSRRRTPAKRRPSLPGRGGTRRYGSEAIGAGAGTTVRIARAGPTRSAA